MKRDRHGCHTRSALSAAGRAPRHHRPMALTLALPALLCMASVPISALWVAGPAGAASTAASASLATVRLGHPPRLPAGAEPGSPPPPSAPLQVDVVLAPRDPAALTAFARAATTLGGPDAGRFLGPGQFAS